MTRSQRLTLGRIVATAALTAALQWMPCEGWTRLAAYLGVYLLIGGDILKKAAWGIAQQRPTDENFLMAVATLGAFALAICNGSGDCNEAIAVMLFYQIGEFFQSYAVGKSRNDIAALMDIRPCYANIERQGVIIQTEPDEVEVGSTIVVRPGEKVPIDGVVRRGTSSLDTSALTGESVPREVECGCEVFSGCINMTGLLYVETTKTFDESTVSKILELMEDCASNKSRSEAFISRFARYYTPIVCCAALALATVPTLWCVLMQSEAFVHTLTVWLYRALVFLVISCPCALVVSIPLTFFAGIGGASKAGILVKGGDYMEMLSRVRTIVFDKTGTLTKGCLEVTAIRAAQPYTNADILKYAALAECASTHPMAISLRKAYGQPADTHRISHIQEISGQGITAMVNGRNVAVGNKRLMHTLGIDTSPCRPTGTVVHVGIEGQYAGHIIMNDVVKRESVTAISQLHRAGVTHTVMLSGDAQQTAEEVGRQVGINQVYGQLLPHEKVNKLEDIIAMRGSEGKVAFVGDGINDAPALRRADVGIAMGAMGSDAAIEAADVVLMDDNPMTLVTAMRLSRRIMAIVWQNITLALGVKGVCLLLGACGMANLWMAIFADVGVMVIAVLNAMRAMRINAVLQAHR